MIEHAQTSAVKTKSNAEFDSVCFLILDQNIVNGTCDTFGVGDYYFIIFLCSYESKFIPIEEFCTFSDERREFGKHHSYDFCRNARIGRECIRTMTNKMLSKSVESHDEKLQSENSKPFNTAFES